MIADAVMDIEAGRHRQAEKKIRKAMKRDPSDAAAVLVHGNLCMATGDWARALMSFADSVRLSDPESYSAGVWAEALADHFGLYHGMELAGICSVHGLHCQESGNGASFFLPLCPT